MQTFFPYLLSSLQGLYSSDEIRMISRILLHRCCGYTENEILLRKDIKISSEQQLVLKAAVERLQNKEPIQYVTGSCSFYGIDFKVAPPVLIPRPETEELVEWIVKDLASVSEARSDDAQEADSSDKKVRLLDVGTGSGCIAVCLAKRFPEIRVEAWDILPEALCLAAENASLQGVDLLVKKINLFQIIGQGTADFFEEYDIIVSNPPYVCNSEKAGMEENVLKYESPQALFVPDEDALKYYRALVELSVKSLKKEGRLYLEINSRFGAETCRLLEPYFEEVVLRKDISGKDRMVRAVRKRKSL